MTAVCTDCDVAAITAAITVTYKIVLSAFTTTGRAYNNNNFRLNIMLVDSCIVSIRVSVYALSFGIKILLYVKCTVYLCQFNIDVVSCEQCMRTYVR